ncbi:MAG: peptidylprolyl isomerase [Acidimicrobiia bacterium]
MKKFLSLVVLGGLALAACGGAGAVAATVDGGEVTVDDVEALIDSNGAAISKEQFAQFLAFEIQWRVINEAATADYGITITEEEVTAEADRIYESVAVGNQTREDFLAERGITEEFLRNIARQGLLDVGIREILGEGVSEPTEEDLDAELRAARAPITTACISHILVDTEEEAIDVMDRLDSGEEFGEVAKEVSTDTLSAENNGIIPCGTLETYVVPFRDAVLTAPVGELHATPVESQFGFHVIMVTDRTDAAEADLPSEEELVDAVRDGAILDELEDWFLAAMEEAEVSVGEEYGTWQANPPTVVPPVG